MLYAMELGKGNGLVCVMWDHFSSTYGTHSLGRLQKEIKTDRETEPSKLNSLLHPSSLPKALKKCTCLFVEWMASPVPSGQCAEQPAVLLK